jgi:hypothetical protein
LIGAVLGGIPNDMINSPATVWRCAVFADVLDAPVSKLTMRDNIDICKNFFNTRALQIG